MSETPDGGYTLDFIGRTLLDMQRELRGMNDRRTRVEERLDRTASPPAGMNRDPFDALFRAKPRTRG